MYKVTLTILVATGIMAFKTPANHSAANVNLTTSFLGVDTSNFDLNANATGSKNNLLFVQKDKEKDKGKGDKGNKGNNVSKNDKQSFDKKEKGNQNSINKVTKKQDNGKNHNKGNNGNGNHKQYEKGHPNFDYVFVNKHGHYSHKNYGQWRSEQARMKHKKYKPVYEYQAIEGFRLIHTRNVFLFNETDYKINLLNVRLAERRRANQISDAEFVLYTNRIAVLQERRAGLNINIDL